jgi:NAD(P)-dependent dehydrogenase (short-subunit alcohol dehydrogenase family)
MPVAIVTGASRGLGFALAAALLRDGWKVVADARGEEELAAAAHRLRPLGELVAIAGDVADPAHRPELIGAAGPRIDLLVNNASLLGPSPQPPLGDYPLAVLEQVLQVNVLAPLALVQLALPRLPEGACIVNITSDAAVSAYPGWGGYGTSKAALDQLTAVLAAEHPGLRIHAVDPGDMNTRMQQEAFPGEDVSDRADPEDVAPAVLALVASGRPSGRHVAAGLPA